MRFLRVHHPRWSFNEHLRFPLFLSLFLASFPFFPSKYVFTKTHFPTDKVAYFDTRHESEIRGSKESI